MDLPFHHSARPGTFENARFLKKVATRAEKVLWMFLRNRNLGVKFRRQHPVDQFVLDFYCHEKRLAVELDGEIHRLNDNQEYDKYRTDALQALGISVIRFTNDEVLNDVQQVLSVIKSRLAGIEHSRT
jgi:cyclase